MFQCIVLRASAQRLLVDVRALVGLDELAEAQHGHWAAYEAAEVAHDGVDERRWAIVDGK